MKEYLQDVPHVLSAVGPVISIVLLLLVALAIWAVFLRPVARQVATGVIVDKTFKPAGETYQYPEGNRLPTRIPIAECFVFQVDVKGLPQTAVYSLNTTAAERFEVGEKVDIVYEVRGVPWIWNVVCILEMKPAQDSPGSARVSI